MAQPKLTVIVTAAHVILDSDGSQLIPGFVYDVKDAPVIQQYLEDDALRVVPVKEDATEVVVPKTAKTTKDSASADSNNS
jgi:hypothetical protein